MGVVSTGSTTAILSDISKRIPFLFTVWKGVKSESDLLVAVY